MSQDEDRPTISFGEPVYIAFDGSALPEGWKDVGYTTDEVIFEAVRRDGLRRKARAATERGFDRIEFEAIGVRTDLIRLIIGRALDTQADVDRRDTHEMRLDQHRLFFNFWGVEPQRWQLEALHALLSDARRPHIGWTS